MDRETEQKTHTGTEEGWGEVRWAISDLAQQLGILEIQLLSLEAGFTELLNVPKPCY